jgi:hypothetical protein
VRKSYVRDAVSLLLLTGAPTVALACCPGGGNGKELAKRGLGETKPMADNLSNDPSWQVYGFERDGIAYYQVNDLAGRVQLIIGKADDYFWALPAGDNARRVSLPHDRVAAPAEAAGKVVYRHPEFILVLLGGGADAVWAVEVPRPAG